MAQSAVCVNGDQSAPRDPKSVRVLVVDDDRDTADSLAAILRAAHHEVDVANDGFTALQKARSFLPHAIFLDINMPAMSGYQLARLARRLPDGHKLLIVAITGLYNEPGGRAESFAAGIDWQLPKPAHPEALLSLLKHMQVVGPDG